MDEDRIDRFFKYVLFTPGCWFWTRKLYKGYARFWNGKRSAQAHRYIYEKMVGEVPKGKVCDHLCNNRSCVNFNHIALVTSHENVLRSNKYNGNKTTCPKGHPYSGENLYLSPRPDRRRPAGQCRQCLRDTGKRYREDHRLQSEPKGGKP